MSDFLNLGSRDNKNYLLNVETRLLIVSDIINEKQNLIVLESEKIPEDLYYRIIDMVLTETITEQEAKFIAIIMSCSLPDIVLAIWGCVNRALARATAGKENLWILHPHIEQLLVNIAVGDKNSIKNELSNLVRNYIKEHPHNPTPSK